jgi:putative DNA methylase
MKVINTINERRLVEAFLCREAVSKESSRHKSVRKGHISTLHSWGTRRRRKAQESTEVYRVNVVRHRSRPDPGLRRIHNPTARLDHAKNETLTS